MGLKEVILFQREYSGCPDDCEMEDEILSGVYRCIEAIFEPCVLVGTVGRWNGTFSGYRYCHTFSDFQGAIGGYDDMIIRQVGTRLHFTLIHHDGRHEMELRRLSDYGYNNRDNASFDYFTEATMKFINRHTKNYGKLSDYITYGRYLMEGGTTCGN
jgi:hypothetical protein